MKPVPFPTRPITIEEATELCSRVRGAICHVDEATGHFQRFHRRLRMKSLASLDDKVGGVVAGDSWKRLKPLRLLVMMMIIKYKHAREYYYELQEQTAGSLTAWKELEREARYCEWEAGEMLGREVVRCAQQMLEKAVRQMAYGWVP